MPVDAPDIALREQELFPNKFIPILPNYDPLALLTSTSTTTSKPPKWPQSSHQFSFVDHHHNSPSARPRPRPPPIIISSMYQPTKASPAKTTATEYPINIFAPTTHLHSTTYQPSTHNSHRKPFKRPDIGWDIKFNVSDELRELLRLEKIKLENISRPHGTHPKWIVTSSRSKHRDADIFVARANNPFGHSTKWKLRYVYGGAIVICDPN